MAPELFIVGRKNKLFINKPTTKENLMNSILSKLTMAILSLVVSTFVFAADKPKEEWLFVQCI